MSPHAVNTFVSDLVQMAQAMERLPQIEAELATVRRELGQAQDTVQRLELKLIDRNTTIDELNAKVRSAEVSRDDAELRFLEADERITQFGNLVKASAAALGLSIAEPPKAEPTTEVTTAAPSTAYASDGTISPGEQEASASALSDPTAPSEAGDGRLSGTATETTTAPASVDATSQGQSEANPTLNPVEANSNPLDTAHDGNAVSQADAQMVGEPQPLHGPYFGLYYIDVPGYVRLEDWLAGGGTEEDYYAGRPDVASDVA